MGIKSNTFIVSGQPLSVYSWPILTKLATSIIPSSTGWVQSTLNLSCVFFFCCFFFYEKQQKQGCIPQSKNFSGLALNLAISLVLEIHMIALILALHITERKVQWSYQSCGNHSTVIVAVTALMITEKDFSLSLCHMETTLQRSQWL